MIYLAQKYIKLFNIVDNYCWQCYKGLISLPHSQKEVLFGYFYLQLSLFRVFFPDIFKNT